MSHLFPPFSEPCQNFTGSLIFQILWNFVTHNIVATALPLVNKQMPAPSILHISISCVTEITVLPLCSDRIYSAAFLLFRLSSPVNGSSNSTISLSAAIARTSATRRFMPPLSYLMLLTDCLSMELRHFHSLYR